MTRPLDKSARRGRNDIAGNHPRGKPPYQLLPDLEQHAFAALKRNILEKGVLIPIERDELGALLDGHHRLRALEELRAEGHHVADPPVLIRAGLTEAEKRAHVRALNLHRRHLTATQRRQVIAEQLGDTPDASDRVIAKRLAVSHTTVAMVRRRMGLATGHSGQFNTRRGADGKMRKLPSPRSLIATSEKQARNALRDLRTVPLHALSPLSTAYDVRTAARIVLREGNRSERLSRMAAPTHLKSLGKYGVIYADPPWQYSGASDPSRTAENHYETLSTEKICALPIGTLATKNAVLFLWATPPKLAEAMEVIKAWGFSYVTGAVWDKQRAGLGSWFRLQHEHLLVATRGKVPPPAPRLRVSSVIRALRAKHSAKPREVAELIAKQFPGVRKIELFARQAAEGWDGWGNEV